MPVVPTVWINPEYLRLFDDWNPEEGFMSEGVRLYAGTQQGLIVWCSAANGWQEVARHFADGIIDSIHGCKQSPENVFVGVTHDGLYRTQDAGKRWAKVLDGDIRFGHGRSDGRSSRVQWSRAGRFVPQ
jgi:hypothetical protein